MWEYISSSIRGAYQYMNLVFGNAMQAQPSPSTDTVNKAKQLFEILREKHQHPEQELDHVTTKHILRNCDDLSSLLNVSNEDGFNVLQASVILNIQEFLLLLLEAGANVNRGKCSLPLHLACWLGRKNIVQILLDHGADLTLESGMCYPQSHVPLRHVPSRFHFLETDIFLCDTDHRLPLMFAIEGGHLDMVRLLLRGVAGPDHKWPAHRLPLHHACRYGSYEAMEFLVNLRPEAVHTTDDEGYTPLLLAVRWGKKFVQFLEERGADMFAVTTKQNGALHELFENVQDPAILFETANYLMALGLEQDIDRANTSGNTCLMNLINLVNREVTYFDKKLKPHETTQEVFDESVLHAIDLVLKHNCDPNTVNNCGINTLHKLILNFDAVTSSNPSSIALGALAHKDLYAANVIVFRKAMELLLCYGVCPNTESIAGRSPLDMLFNVVLNMDGGRLQEYSEGLLDCFKLLCRYKASPSHTIQRHKASVANLTKLGAKCLAERSLESQLTASDLLKDLLVLLFQNGFNQNFCTLLCKPQPEGASGNILSELVKLSHRLRHPLEVDFVYDWVKLALLWGSNPDLEPHPSEPIICHSQGSMYFKPKGSQPVSQLMYELQDSQQILEAGGAHKLLMLFYHTMDHNVLFQSLKNAKEMSRFDANRSPSRDFLQMVNQVSSQPRSLQVCAKVEIYKGMQRQINNNVPKLLLPYGLKKQLLNID